MKLRSLAAMIAALALFTTTSGCKDDEPAPESAPKSETDVNIQVDKDGGSVGVEHKDESGNDVNVEVGTDSATKDDPGGSS
jgi:hypothetical protein